MLLEGVVEGVAAWLRLRYARVHGALLLGDDGAGVGLGRPQQLLDSVQGAFQLGDGQYGVEDGAVGVGEEEGGEHPRGEGDSGGV